MSPPRIVRRTVPATSVDWPAEIHPVLRRVYAARGVASPVDIEHKLTGLLSPLALGGIDRACELLEAAIREDAPVWEGCGRGLSRGAHRYELIGRNEKGVQLFHEALAMQTGYRGLRYV